MYKHTTNLKVKLYSNKSNILKLVAKTPTIPKYVTVGTSKADLYKILGKPYVAYHAEGSDSFQIYYVKDRRYPNNAAVFFCNKIADEYYVAGWDGLYKGLKVSDGNEKNSGTFTYGSSINDVNKAMATPKCFEYKYTYTYENYEVSGQKIEYMDGSSVRYDLFGKVIGWDNKGSLKVTYGASKPTYSTLSLGSTLSEVLKALGTPSSLGSCDTLMPRIISY